MTVFFYSDTHFGHKLMARLRGFIPVGDVNKGEPTAGHPAPVPAEVQGLIAQCAYELYAQRGFQHGYHEGDWLEAEKHRYPVPRNAHPVG